jgi:hypothetical protein
MYKNLERKMSLQEEFMHVNANKFAINDGAGHCVIHLLWASFDEESKIGI